ERRGLAAQNNEGGLEGVLGVGLVAEDAAADAQHHRTMSAHQRREGRLVAFQEKTFEKLPVRQPRAAVGPREPAQDWYDQVLSAGHHLRSSSAGRSSLLPSIVPGVCCC